MTPARPARPASGAAAAQPHPPSAPDARGEARKTKSATPGAQKKNKNKKNKNKNKNKKDKHHYAVARGLGEAGFGGGARSSAQAAEARCYSPACAGTDEGRAERPLCGIAGVDEASLLASSSLMQRRPERATPPSQACSEEHVQCHRRRVVDKAILATSLTQRLEHATPRAHHARADEHVHCHRRRVDEASVIASSLMQRPERATPWARHQQALIIVDDEQHVHCRRRVDDEASVIIASSSLLMPRPERTTPRAHQARADERHSRRHPARHPARRPPERRPSERLGGLSVLLVVALLVMGGEMAEAVFVPRNRTELQGTGISDGGGVFQCVGECGQSLIDVGTGDSFCFSFANGPWESGSGACTTYAAMSVPSGQGDGTHGAIGSWDVSNVKSMRWRECILLLTSLYL
jgi:hypothetical protein